MALFILLAPLAGAVTIVGSVCALFTLLALSRRIHAIISTTHAHIPAARHRGSWLSTLFLGDFQAIKDVPPGQQHLEWMRELGPVFQYRHMFYVQRLLLADPRAMMHILNRSSNYPKPEHTTTFLSVVLGNGLVTAEGAAHKRQKKIVTPAFTPSAVRQLQDVMEKHAAKLVEKISGSVEAVSNVKNTIPCNLLPGQTEEDTLLALPLHATRRGPTAVIDVLFWLSRTTLDIIGEAGFNHHFDSLNSGDTPSPLMIAIHELVSSVMDVDLSQAIAILLSEKPGLGWLRNLPTKRNKAMWKSQAILKEEARCIVTRAKADIAVEMGLSSNNDSKSTTSVPHDSLQPSTSENATSRALMWRLIRANMAADLKENERLSDDELLDQVTTFIFAGHETTATQTSWALHLLAGSQRVQGKLREELRGARVGEETVGGPPREFVGINELPFLDSVAREVVRLMPSVVSTVRVVQEDDVVPLSRPYTSADGKGTFDHLVLPKGHELFIPLAAIQQSPEVWGDDASVFRPERWLELPSSVLEAKLPGHTLAFLAGARSCPGQRLAMQELKVLLAHLVTAFEFRRVPQYELVQRQMIVRRALVKGQEQHGTRLPLFVTKLEQ